MFSIRSAVVPGYETIGTRNSMAPGLEVRRTPCGVLCRRPCMAKDPRWVWLTMTISDEHRTGY